MIVRAGIVLCLLSSLLSVGVIAAENDFPEITAADWPWWRGPHRNGIAPEGQSPPFKWGDAENVAWKVPVPGKGHGSPIVIGDQVLLQTAEADAERHSLLCFNRHNGTVMWRAVISEGGFETKQNAKSTMANSTPATDGKQVFVNTLHDGAVYLTAFDRRGLKQWERKVADFVLHQGFSSSPAIYKSAVIVSVDSKQIGGALTAYNRFTGNEMWTRTRPKLPNYTSPVILNVAGRDQMIFTGCNLVTSLDPLTGQVLWETAGSTEECVTSTVTDGKHIFTSGGYPKNHLAAIVADGSNKVAWENTTRVYVPSMVARDGYLYGVLDAGVASCWKTDTGEEQWKNRVGGTFSSSLVLAGDNLYATNEEGQTFIFKATPKAFELVAENKLGDEVFATPVIAHNKLFHRVAHNIDGKRQEFLYCIEAP
ncbi:MAG TPA: PQQ-binding-like beta-propeller repeat protein [Planctomycetaceae bacterium]|nr:PQQ-binding-like beta-propeller repeat protein [Planctomycetaceae bacterium]